MDSEKITKDNIVYFFNKYKYNSDQIFHLERRLLKESYDFDKWEEMLSATSALTRNLYTENESLLEEYVRPAIRNPQGLSAEAVHTFLLHITFFLFENNIDSHVTDDLVNAILEKCPDIPDVDRFEALMNLGISNTVTMQSDFNTVREYFEQAMQIYPRYETAPNDDIRIHMLFCRIFELLCFALYKNNDYADFLRIVKEIQKMVLGGNVQLYKKMWGEKADFLFHINLLNRYFKIYGIFTAGRCNFALKDESDEQKAALNEIVSWILDEYTLQGEEGNVNPMVYTFYFKQKFLCGEITKKQYFDALRSFFEGREANEPYIYPAFPFPIDDDPVDPQFAVMLDKMKIFNRSFSLAHVLMPELYKLSEDRQLNKNIANELLRYYESAEYAAKGFLADSFIVENLLIFAKKMENEKEFISFMQSIFVHREITSAIHFSMVSTLAGVCLSHFIEQRPELFVTEKYPSAEDVTMHRAELLAFIKNAGFLHDIGKLALSHLINLHFRRITNSEFRKITEHTTLGGQIADQIPFLTPYRDMILGHHKFYDGESGYPQSFNTNTSKNKIFIDLISICDTLDTATDYKGRNYASKKTFDDIFTELIEMTRRYSPVLTGLINEDEALKEELRYMTGTGRNYTSWETYRKFVQPNTDFSEADEKKISPYDPQFEQNVVEFYKKLYPNLTEDEAREYFLSLTEGSRSACYVLHTKKNELIGILCGRILLSPAQGEYFFEICDITVLPHFRRKGWGTELVNFVSAEMKKKGVQSLRIAIQNDFNTETFFWIMGFSQTSKYLMVKKL